MVALPGLKFLFLAVRQITRPAVRAIVTRANTKRGLTHSVCIGLGRVSLGMQGTIAEWTKQEHMKKEAQKKKDEEARLKKIEEEAAKEQEADEKAAEEKKNAKTSPEGEKEAEVPRAASPRRINLKEFLKSSNPSSRASPASSSDAPSTKEGADEKDKDKDKEKEKEEEKLHTVDMNNIIAPRSRSLLLELTYGPLPKDSTDTYDPTVFLDPKRSVGEAARVFVRHPYRSSFDVLREKFLVPFPEKRLVDAGAELLIELLAYLVMATILYIELKQQWKTTAAKEAYVNARLEAVEAKVNELARFSQTAEATVRVEELPPVPALQIQGRLHLLKRMAEVGVDTVQGALSSLQGGGGTDGSATSPPKEKTTVKIVGPVYKTSTRLPQQTPDPKN